MCKSKLIINANVITGDGILEGWSILIENDRIGKLMTAEESNLFRQDGLFELIDAGHAYVSAGFIDLHSDNVEGAVQPRPTSLIDFDLALGEHERQLVNQGITTMYHAISFMSQADALKEKQIRKPENIKAFLEMVDNIKNRNHLIRHRFHCRFDICNISGFEALLSYLESGRFDLLSFTDHTPGQGQFRDTDIIRDRIRKNNPDMDESAVEELLQERMSVPKLPCYLIEKAAETAHAMGIPIASHDDDSLEKVEFVKNVLKADISEFPVEIPIAKKAKELGMLTVAGAPNVLLGRSHTNNLSATEAILDGCIDILCSDYYPSSLLHAVFKLYNDFDIPLWQGIGMVTRNPAMALGIDKDYGSVTEGKKADLLLIHMAYGKPVITKVFIDGQLVSALNYRSKGEKIC